VPLHPGRDMTDIATAELGITNAEWEANMKASDAAANQKTASARAEPRPNSSRCSVAKTANDIVEGGLVQATDSPILLTRAGGRARFWV